MSQIPALISDLAVILISAGLVTLLFKKLKQPVVLGYKETDLPAEGEILLNVTYRLKQARQLLPAGYAVAEEQLEIAPYPLFQVELAETGQKASLYEDLVHAVVSAGEVQVTFGKWSGWIGDQSEWV